MVITRGFRMGDDKTDSLITNAKHDASCAIARLDGVIQRRLRTFDIAFGRNAIRDFRHNQY